MKLRSAIAKANQTATGLTDLSSDAPIDSIPADAQGPAKNATGLDLVDEVKVNLSAASRSTQSAETGSDIPTNTLTPATGNLLNTVDPPGIPPPAVVVGLDSAEEVARGHLSPRPADAAVLENSSTERLKVPLFPTVAGEVMELSSSPEPPSTPTPQPKRPSDVAEYGPMKRLCGPGDKLPYGLRAWVVGDSGIENLIYELRDTYDFLPIIGFVKDDTEDTDMEVFVCKPNLWEDATTSFPGLSVDHLSAIIQFPKFMGYTNPARSSTYNAKMESISMGHVSFKGVVENGSPLKMISYGIVNDSYLTEPKEVLNKGMFVKSIEVFPLPGEWERTVGFLGTCANVPRLIFSSWHGALSYSTRMVPGLKVSGAVAARRRTESTGLDVDGLPSTWGKVPIYDARHLCSSDFDIKKLQLCKRDDLNCLDAGEDIKVGSFVGVVYCAKWIRSRKHAGKDRVLLSIAEAYLFACPP